MSNHVKKALHSELGSHFIDYLVLATATVFFLLFLSFFQGERYASYLIIILFASFYILWGIVHHIRDESLHLKNVLEYILISFGVLLMITVIFSY